MNLRQWRPGLPYSSVAPPRFNSRIGSAAFAANVFEAGLPYSKRLSVHRSCVNALSFSHDGRLLASAGDDRRVLVWDFRPDSLNEPMASVLAHRANIFCLDFSSSDRFVYSGSVDYSICKIDISRSDGNTVSKFTHQSGSIRGVSADPENDEVFLSASEDGTVCLYDSRSGEQPVGTIERNIEVCDVRYHPRTGTLFLSADEIGRVLLHDARMAFESSRSADGKMGAVLTYVTTPVRQPSIRTIHLNASSVAFDREGKRFTATFMNTRPTMYDTSDPYPLATFASTFHPDGSPIPAGERSYANHCTTKHGSFGGPGLPVDEYYTAGSDDFRAYVWKIPSTEELKEKRRVVGKSSWIETSNETAVSSLCRDIGFTRPRDGNVYVPVEIGKPLFRLQGHESIINTSLIHPHLPHIVTAGVERHVVVHGPIGANSSNSSSTQESNLEIESHFNGFIRTNTEVRQLPEDDVAFRRRLATALLFGHSSVNDEDADLEIEEQKTIAFFDQCIRENTEVDLFDQTRDLLSSDIDFDLISSEMDGIEEDSSNDGSVDDSSDEMDIGDD